MTKSKDDEDNFTLLDGIKLAAYLGFGYVAYSVYSDYESRDDKIVRLAESHAPADQRVFDNIVGRAVAAADEAANDAAEALAYINGNRELCSRKAFNPFGQKTGWIGVFDEANLTDDNTDMYLEMEIGHDNKIRAEVPAAYRNTVLGLKGGQPVSFSGSFNPGNMNENQCLRTTWSLVTGSTPELTRRSFSYDLTSIAAIPES